MEWIFFAVGVAVIAIIGIAVGLFIAGRVSGWAERRGGDRESAYMTPVGPPPDAELPGAGAGQEAAAADVSGPSSVAGEPAAGPGEPAAGPGEPGGGDLSTGGGAGDA